jgi:alpha-beta hydrolase superfamily lysophospholipase
VSDDQMQIDGTEGAICVRTWERAVPSRIVVIAHGYGEHIGRYEHVAQALAEDGAVVYGPDHIGHGLSEGERAVIADFEHAVDDLHAVATLARQRHLGIPVVLIGHSMGGLIAARYAQRFGDELAGLVLSGPLLGFHPVFAEWLANEPPNDPIDPAVLSRDLSVGEAYANDPLVHHGGWSRTMLEGLRAVSEKVAAGRGFGKLPTYYVHGEQDQLVPLVLAQPAVLALQGDDFTERIVPGARHEVFNETDRDETIGLVREFVRRVS